MSPSDGSRVAAGPDEADPWAAAELADIMRLHELWAPRAARRRGKRDAGRSPTRAEDPHNAIIRLCAVEGAGRGPLAGVRLGVKDSIPVAGVPMTGGEAGGHPPVPAEDAVVVGRLLDSGATVTAKTNLCGLVGFGFGHTRNPHAPAFSPGFSSSGSGAAVASRLVDAALGTDVAGSIRIPAAWCGVVGMKPTAGLVPTSFGLSAHGLNNIGPMTPAVRENAAMLGVMAGAARSRLAGWHALLAPRPSRSGRWPLRGLRVGVVVEASAAAACTPAAREAFGRAADCLTALGAEPVPVTIPLWSEASTLVLATLALWAIASEGHWLGADCDYLGGYDEALVRPVLTRSERAYRRGVLPLVAERLRRRDDQVSHLARARNVRLELRRQVEAALSDAEVLITPTTAVGPFRLGDPDIADAAASRRLLKRIISNVAPLNLTGHPALSVPAGVGEHGLPAGLQIVGGTFAEATLYRVGLAFEAAWSSL